MGSNGHSAGERTGRALRDQRAIELRIAGASYPQIARQLGCSVSTAHSSVQRVLTAAAAVTEELRPQAQTLELIRLDFLTTKVTPQVSQGNLGAVDRTLNIMNHRAKILGLYAAEKKEVTGKDGGPVDVHTDSALNQRIDRILGLTDGEGKAGA